MREPAVRSMDVSDLSSDPAAYDEARRALHDRLVASRGRAQVEDDAGRLRAAYGLMLLEPELGACLEALGARLRLAARVPADLLELAILGVAAAMRSRTQWSIHLPLARAAGIGAEELPDDPAAPPTLVGGVRAAVWRSVGAWTAGRREDEEDRRRLVAALGPPGVYELVTIVGYYRMLADQLAVFGLDER